MIQIFYSILEMGLILWTFFKTNMLIQKTSFPNSLLVSH